MSPEQRNAAMDELHRLNREIRNMREDLDPDDPERQWQASIKSDLGDAKRERERLLMTFPEVRYWPIQGATAEVECLDACCWMMREGGYA